MEGISVCAQLLQGQKSLWRHSSPLSRLWRESHLSMVPSICRNRGFQNRIPEDTRAHLYSLQKLQMAAECNREELETSGDKASSLQVIVFSEGKFTIGHRFCITVLGTTWKIWKSSQLWVGECWPSLKSAQNLCCLNLTLNLSLWLNNWSHKADFNTDYGVCVAFQILWCGDAKGYSICKSTALKYQLSILFLQWPLVFNQVNSYCLWTWIELKETVQINSGWWIKKDV